MFAAIAKPLNVPFRFVNDTLVACVLALSFDVLGWTFDTTDVIALAVEKYSFLNKDVVLVVIPLDVFGW